MHERAAQSRGSNPVEYHGRTNLVSDYDFLREEGTKSLCLHQSVPWRTICLLGRLLLLDDNSAHAGPVLSAAGSVNFMTTKQAQATQKTVAAGKNKDGFSQKFLHLTICEEKNSNGI